MISITVHHHHHQQQQMSACGASGQVAIVPEGMANNSSNVEVQYLTSGCFRQPAKVAAREQLQSFKPIMKQQQVDLNNNATDQLNSQSNYKTEQQQQSNNTMAADNKTVDNNNNKLGPMKLHSRSISLIVNPEFRSSDESGDVDENVPLCRRRSLPRLKRRTRLQQQQESEQLNNLRLPIPKPRARDGQQQQQPLIEQSTRFVVDAPGSYGGNHEMTRDDVSLRCSMSLPDFIQPKTSMQTTITTTTTTNISMDSETKFREAGILLREISDEFARCRRRTI